MKISLYISKYYFCALFFLLLSLAATAQDKTIVRGTLTDSHTGEPVAFASVIFKGTTTGTLTDINGKYKIETTARTGNVLSYSFIGYKTETRTIVPGIEQTVDVIMSLSSITLDEVIVKPVRKEYHNKNNPAVELIESVVANKDRNRPESYDNLQYKTYEKIQFAFSNVKENVRNSNIFSDFSFIFDNIDTTRRIGNDILPVFIKETLSEHYFRKNPAGEKEVILGEKSVNLEEYLNSKGTSNYLNYLYQDINIYDNEILFLTNKFLSPIASTAPLFYRYYILDTLPVSDTRCIRLFFEPRNKSDFLFHGNLYITMDSTYSVRKIDIGINKAINIDWVKDISITQDFDRADGRSWMLSKEEISIDFGIFRNTVGLYGQRTTAYRDYRMNQPVADDFFRGPQKVDRTDVRAEENSYWDENRFVPLTKSERKIYTTIDSLRLVPDFRKKMDAVMLITVGFLDLGKTEIGPVSSFYSYNSIEGSRFRFGGRTTPDFSKKITFDGYAAYGVRDQAWKYAAGVTWSLTPRTIYQFPVKSLKLSYMRDTRIPGQELQFTQADNILLSFKRGVNDKLYLNNTLRAEYLNEFENHFSFLLGYNYTRQLPWGNLQFLSSDGGTGGEDISYLNISEAYLNLRYAPNESFYQGKMYRTSFSSRNPVIQLKMAAGSKSIGNDYDYLRLQFNISRRYYMSILGYTDISFEAGKIFGEAPYPLLFVHRANQTYAYQRNSYNLMNFLEFVSDRYVSLNVDHSFNGFFLNKVPLVKKLKLREIVTCKVLYGKLYDSNNPTSNSNLLLFPSDKQGVPLTYTLDNKPYIEGSIGLSNIFRIFRVDLVKRFTYLNNPLVDDLGVRVQFRLDI